MQEILSSFEKHLRTTNKKKFSILIPTWNNLPYLKLCIESIIKNSKYHHQIIVHINEGKDGTLEWIKAQENIDYTYSSKNAGVCYALNYARTIATTDYILYINDDMYACPDWDAQLAEAIDHCPDNLFFFSSTMIERNTLNTCSISADYGADLSSFDEVKLLQDQSQLVKNDWHGATWPPNIVHKDIWDIVGGYSIEFSPGFYSDPDFSMKLWKAGVRTFKGIGKSRVYHFGSKSVSRIKTEQKGYYQFINKWGFTSSWLTNKILKRGDPFSETQEDKNLNNLEKVKMQFKRWIAASR